MYVAFVARADEQAGKNWFCAIREPNVAIKFVDRFIMVVSGSKETPTTLREHFETLCCLAYDPSGI